MLEAITDFWKPVKKSAQPAKLSLKDLQIGSVIGFGYVPQVALNGRKLTVTAINSYQFGQDVLTSFVLSNEKDVEVSMIVAEAQGEQYLAISRRISISDRNKLFDSEALKRITTDETATTFKCRDNVPELKGWLVGGYKREIQGMRGFLHRADFRDGSDGSHAGEEFQYTLLGSNSNEHAIEIESYIDGHVDIYATIYRRTSDISEITYSGKSQAIDFKSTAKDDDKADLAEISDIEENKNPEEKEPETVKAAPVEAEPEKLAVDEEKTEAKEEEKFEEENLETIKAIQKEIEADYDKDRFDSPRRKAVKLDVISLPNLEPTPLEPAIEKEDITKIETIKNNDEEKKEMGTSTANENKFGMKNGAGADYASGYLKDLKQEINTVTKTVNGLDNESVECDLRVANHVIDEAIRNEMRLSDVVRRIIELPVSHQEAVHIPINLSDEDYSLLAIRYGIPASDRNAIKLRIIQDLSDFSGSKKKN
jgi:hypothetical protein